MLCLIVYGISLYFIVRWTFSPKRDMGERLFSIIWTTLAITVDFYIGWGWIGLFLWGGVCWASDRAGEI